MAVLPESSMNLTGGVEFIFQPSKTWHINKEIGRIDGVVDGYEAVRQAVEIILNIERFRWQIYEPSSGMQWEGLLGQDHGYVTAELQRRVTEALLMDDRIQSIGSFETSENGDVLTVSLTVNTVYGEVKTSSEVNLPA